MIATMWLVASLLACKPDAPCGEGSDPSIDVAQQGAWNIPEGEVDMGIPPQGGAPYAPFEVRLIDVEIADMYRITMEAEVDGETYVTPPYIERFVCRNVGEEAGTRYTPDLHMRFFGTDPPSLDGKRATLRFEAWVDTEAPVASRTLEVTLRWTLGPR